MLIFIIITSIYLAIGSIFAGIRISKDINVLLDPNDDLLEFEKKSWLIIFIILMGIDLGIKWLLIMFLWPILAIIRVRGTLSNIVYLLW